MPVGRRGSRMTCLRRTRAHDAWMRFFSIPVFAACAMVVVHHAWDAAAQSAMPKSDELRTLDVTPLEIAEGKRVAESSCAGCHGLDGISTLPMVPNIAGQRPPYLFLELQAYR